MHSVWATYGGFMLGVSLVLLVVAAIVAVSWSLLTRSDPVNPIPHRQRKRHRFFSIGPYN